jgi:hypothetical protein
LENLKGRDHVKDLGIDRKTILEWILGKGHGLDASGTGKGRVVGPCEHSNEPLSLIKGNKFLD